MNTFQLKNHSYYSLFDLNSRENELLYFKMKNKYEYLFTEKEKVAFISLLNEKLNKISHWCITNTIVVPETSNYLLKSFLISTGKKIIYLQKNSKEKIIESIQQQPMMKSEAKKLFSSLNNMKTIKIADIAGNQRKRFQTCLFNDISEQNMDTDIVFLDDSIFSGNTFLAAQEKLKNFNVTNIILFNKNL